MFRNPVILSLALLVVLSACGAAATATEAPGLPIEIPTTIPTETPASRLVYSFETVPYRDEAIGFEFDYPVRWTSSGLQTLGDRADLLEFTAPEGQVLSLVLYRWEPVGDLPAYLTQRRLAWEASGSTVLVEESLTLAGGWPGASFILQVQDGSYWFVAYAPVGERYLEFSSPAGYDLLQGIVSTLRPVNRP
ncbi:MAG: hypothetical protein JXB85_17115 [Anaerolineales bacterium]|nr:hypothetical protein [Anaerolineales bacterium]